MRMATCHQNAALSDFESDSKPGPKLHEVTIWVDWLIISKFKRTSTPKGSYSAKTGEFTREKCYGATVWELHCVRPFAIRLSLNKLSDKTWYRIGKYATRPSLGCLASEWNRVFKLRNVHGFRLTCSITADDKSAINLSIHTCTWTWETWYCTQTQLPIAAKNHKQWQCSDVITADWCVCYCSITPTPPSPQGEPIMCSKYHIPNSAGYCKIMYSRPKSTGGKLVNSGNSIHVHVHVPVFPQHKTPAYQQDHGLMYGKKSRI